MDGERQSVKKSKKTSKEKSADMDHQESRAQVAKSSGSENEHRYWENRKARVRKKGFVCKECWKVFSHGSHFVQHQKSHTGQSAHECYECGKRFNKKFNLDRHMMTHSRQVKATARARPVNKKKRQLP
ncbi:hypothetical protein XELAEV_18018989mg [Xenopus laevis]|uniref:C2H2-type domain-containing protein n=1 Tax=Xenopus laevis TaxID=8355 RepID=A0A974HTY9_XENLA|nr:hypothetical protein XELAEV_18018989mg [Xenopus laevis]